MRWFLRISLLLAVLIAAYTIWPFVDLYRLSSALERGDIKAVEQHVSFLAVRNSVARQVIGTYFAMTGEDGRVGKFTRSLAASAGTPIAEGIVADTVTPERLPELFWPEESQRQRTGGVRLAPMDLGNVWRLYASSEYRGKDFHVSVPPNVPKANRYKLRLRLTSWTWRLVDVELPQNLRIKLAQALVKATERYKQAQ